MVYVTHDQVEAMTLGERIAVLKDGRLQQVADPRTLYHRPANRFVAGFIGSPPMNFLDATVDGDGTVTLAGVQAFRPAPGTALRGGRVTLGVRPEDLTLESDGGGSLPATLEVREPLGNETLLYWASPAGAVVSRLAGDAGPAEGERASLHFRYDRLRWFDPETGATIEG
jgi:ABC-type sugar transport system ATPase subunit